MGGAVDSILAITDPIEKSIFGTSTGELIGTQTGEEPPGYSVAHPPATEVRKDLKDTGRRNKKKRRQAALLTGGARDLGVLNVRQGGLLTGTLGA